MSKSAVGDLHREKHRQSPVEHEAKQLPSVEDTPVLFGTMSEVDAKDTEREGEHKDEHQTEDPGAVDGSKATRDASRGDCKDGSCERRQEGITKANVVLVEAIRDEFLW